MRIRLITGRSYYVRQNEVTAGNLEWDSSPLDSPAADAYVSTVKIVT